MKVYLAKYNDCIHESQPRTLSAHFTPLGAQKAIDYHRMERIKWWEFVYENDEDKVDEVDSAMRTEEWSIQEMEVQE